MRAEVEVAVCGIARCEGAVPESVIYQAVDVLRDEERIQGTVESEDEPEGCSNYCAEELSWLADIGALERVVGAKNAVLGYTRRSTTWLSTGCKKGMEPWAERKKDNEKTGHKKGWDMITRRTAMLECIRMILEADHTIPRDRIEKAMTVLRGRHNIVPEVVSPEEAKRMANLSEWYYAKAIKKGYLARVIRGPIKGGTFVGICRESVERYIAGQYIGK